MIIYPMHWELNKTYQLILKIYNILFWLISNIISTKNCCCCDTKAAFTVGSKTIIKFGFNCYYDDYSEFNICYVNFYIP